MSFTIVNHYNNSSIELSDEEFNIIDSALFEFGEDNPVVLVEQYYSLLSKLSKLFPM